ncbi:hypothetical protein ACFE04_016733 [Oxalis oulophora]
MENKVEVLDEFQVGPPPGSLPATLSLPLTVFDLRILIDTRRATLAFVFFYAYPQSLDHFTNTTIPSLKSSLSLTLRRFFPYVSKLIIPPAPQKPYFLFTEGDSVSFIVAQYVGDDNLDFDHFVSDDDSRVVLHPLVRKLPPATVLPDDTYIDHILAIQVTLFPNKGFCIGYGQRHVVADMTSFNHFVTSWASICNSNDEILTMPSFNRAGLKHPYETESMLLKELYDSLISSDESQVISYIEKVSSTFEMRRTHIEKLKQYFSNKGLVHLSSFVVVCSYFWVCLTKSLEISDEKMCRLSFAADCRNRFGTWIPLSYFGNCIVTSFAAAKRSELVEHNGLIVAARAIDKCIKALKDNSTKALENSVEQQSLGSSLLLIVVGSSNVSHYKSDFGWGSPKMAKPVISNMISSKMLSIAKSRDEDGGLALGLQLKSAEMDAFTRLYYRGLRDSLL